MTEATDFTEGHGRVSGAVAIRVRVCKSERGLLNATGRNDIANQPGRYRCWQLVRVYPLDPWLKLYDLR